MKKFFLLTLLFLSIILLPSSKVDNRYCFSENQALLIYNTMEVSKKALPTSQLPSLESNQALYMIDSIQKIIVKQYQTFHDSTKVK